MCLVSSVVYSFHDVVRTGCSSCGGGGRADNDDDDAGAAVCELPVTEFVAESDGSLQQRESVSE